MIPFIDLKSQQRQIKDKIQARINTVLEHGQYIMGPEVAELEQKLADYIGTKHAIAVSSGTDAILMALMVLDVKPGDEIIVPDFTFFATASMITLLGAKPITIDIDPKTYNMNPSLIEAKITSRTKAIIPVSLYGQCVDMDAINTIANKHNIPVIEDGCQSFGAIYKGKKSLALSTIGCTSFFPSKPLGCYGDSGAIFTDNDELAHKMTEIRVHGQKAGGRYLHVRQGINGRIDSIQAGILIEKLAIFDEEMKKRPEIAAKYSEALKDKFIVPFIEDHNTSAWAQYTIQVDNREKFCNKLQQAGIPTAIHYPMPLSKLPVYESLKLETWNISYDVSQKVVSLPMGPYLAISDQKTIIEQILSF